MCKTLKASCILALDESNGIGFYNEVDDTFTIPWKHAEDMKLYGWSTLTKFDEN